MTDLTTNDNQPNAAGGDVREPDAHGQAALLLVESLLHALIERSVLTVADAADIVDTTCDVKREVADDLGDSSGTMLKSLGLLRSIQQTLLTDLLT